ncbi:hypothetical protein GCM10023159_18050 [Brevibacterium yomogidense]
MISLQGATSAIRMAQAAARPAVDIKTRASDVVDELKGVVGYAGALLARWDPTRSHHLPLAVSRYEDSVAEAVVSGAYVSDPKWHKMQQRRSPVRWIDVPGQSSSPFFRDVLRPHGLYEGLTVPLYSPTSYVGMLALNVDSYTPPSEDVVALLEACVPSLSALVESAGQGGLLIASDGTVGGYVDGEVPDGLIDAAQGLVRSGRSPSKFMVKGTGRTVFPAEIVPCGAAAESQHLVSWRRGSLPYGLSARELDVVSGLVAGLSNREISARHGISHRTVSTHVERILHKFSASSRTAVASIAIGEGIYVPSATDG